MLAVNPLLRFTPPELVEEGRVSARRRICEAKQPWVSSVRSRLPEPAVRLLATARAAGSRLRGAGRVTGWLDELVRRDVRVYCICGDEDALPFTQVEERSRARWWSSGHVRIDVVPGLDHALTPASQRDAACDRLTEELHRMGLAVQRDAAAATAPAAGATSGGPA